MSKVCEILSTHSDDQTTEVVATVTLGDDGSTLRFSGKGSVIGFLREVPVPLTQGKITASSDPAKWFGALPFTLNGAAMRAHMVGATDADMEQLLADLKKELAPND